MRLRYWLCNALSGNVQRELVDVVSASHSSRLDDRGSLRLTLSLEAVSRDGVEPDWVEVARRRSQLAPLMYTVAVTAGSGVVGEYVVDGWEGSTGAATVDLTGFAWERYPAFRSLHKDHIHKNVNRGTVARDLLIGAFQTWNTGMQMSIPSTSPSGTVTLERKTRTCYYSDALAEVMEAAPGGEWVVTLSGAWSGDVLTEVTRTVAWGWPEVSRASSILLTAGAPGTRHGNSVISGGEDGNRYAQSVYGVGPGQGDKQPFVGLSDPTRTNAGSLNSTKNISFPGVDDTAHLTKLTQQALTEAQNLGLPWTITARVDELAAVPRVGDVVTLAAERTWAWPDGITAQVRVGEVAWSGPLAETVTLLVAGG